MRLVQILTCLKALRGVEDEIAALYSAQSKKDSKEIARIMKEAEDKGVMDQVVAGIKAMSVAPVDVVANALGTAAPAITAGLATLVTGGTPLVGAALTLGTGATMGAGTVKSAIYDATKQVLAEKTKMTPEQIEAAAVKAQEYGGENLDQILLGAGIGAIGARTGAEPVIARQLAKDIVGRSVKAEAGESAVTAAVRDKTAKATALAAERGVVKQGAITAGTEFATEFPQGGQEQLAQNLALQRQGFDVPTMRGVVSQGTMEGLAGAGMGAVSGGREGYTAKRDVAAGQTPDQGDISSFTTESLDKRTQAPQPTQEQLDLMNAAALPGAGTPPTTTTSAEPASQEVVAKLEKLKKARDRAEKTVNKSESIGSPEYEAAKQKFEAADTKYKAALEEEVAKDRAKFAASQAEGAPSGTDITAGGTSVGVDAAADTTVNAPGTSVDQPGSMGGAGAAIPASTVGTKTELPALTAETQTEINRRRDEILDLIDEGAPTRKINAKLGFLNRMEAENGLELFKPSGDTLPAKEPKYVSVQSLIDQGKQAKATPQDTSPAFQVAGSSPVAVQAAMNFADKYEKRAEAERQRLLEESRGESTPNIKVDAVVIDNYNAKREEINAAADEHNATRDKLASNLKNTMTALKEAELESERIDDQLEATKQKGDDKAVLKLGEQANEINRRAEDLVLQITDAEKALKEHGGVKYKLPNWNKGITPVEKEVYLENILNNTPAEHEKAARALMEFQRKQGRESREGEGTLDRREQRLIKGYEDNREAAGKSFGFKFPEWNKLSDLAKSAYFKEVARNVGLQQDVGFAKVAEQIIKESKDLTAAKKAEAVSQINKHQRRVQILTKRNQSLLERLNRDYNRRAVAGIGKGVFLPSNIVQMIKDNNIQGVLQYLRTNQDVGGPHKKIFKSLAQALFNMKLNVKIELVDSLPEGRLAEYDSSYKDANTGQLGLISVTPEGLTAHTVLHEIIHAGTLKVLYKYLKGDLKSLTPEQRDACDQLQDIMETTREALEDSHPNAYENLIEFVSYALTDKVLQEDLAAFESGQKIEATVLPESKGKWSKFKLAIAGILDLAKVYFRQNKVRQDAPVNYFLEVSAAMEDILSPQDEQIFLPANLAAKGKQPKKSEEPKKPKETRKGGTKDPELRKGYAPSESETAPSKLTKAIKDLFTVQGWRNKATAFVDTTYEMGSRERRLDLGNKIIRNMDDSFNNIYERMTLATGEKLQFLTHHLDQPLTDLKQAFGDWMKLTGKSYEDASIDFHMFAEMFHEPERRKALFVQSVPLSTTKNLVQNGKPISAAERRTQILGDRSKGTPGLVDQVELTDAQKKQLWTELTNLANNYHDAYGYSPRADKIGKPKNAAQAKLLTDMNSDTYTALGINMEEVETRKKEFAELSQEEQDAITKIFDHARELSNATKELNMIGHYWSFPVSNITGMFDYQYYMPFKNDKNNNKPSEKDLYLDPEAISSGVALQDIEHTTHGRFGISTNPLLQLMSDAYRSADRAGRRNLTQSIKNALPKSDKNPNGTGIILGSVREHIPFASRDKVDMSQYKGGANIFHYNDDGSIDILQVGEKNILEAIRYSFKNERPLWDLANDVTGWIGAQHTRYNINFAPKNFVVDMFTNAWNIGGGRMGPLSAPKYIGMVAGRVLQNGLGKAWEVALLNEKGDTRSQQMMINSAKKDPFVRDMLELIKFGGKTAYIESFSIKKNMEKLRDLKTKGWVARSKESVDAFLDTWSGMFELTSRTAAYSLFREHYYKKNLAEKMPDAEAYRAACEQAAAETKNLTNFEKVGTYGRELGALYMFIRPSAISATRAIETAAPAFTPVAWAEQHMPAAVQKDSKAKEEYIKNFKTLRRNSQIMVTGLLGAGYATY
jgi:peptidyl-tRNA hydrolase